MGKGGIGGSLRANARFSRKNTYNTNSNNNGNGGEGGGMLEGEDEDTLTLAKTFEEIARKNEIDLQMGFPSYVTGPTRLGWMLNMQPVIHKLHASY